MVWHNDKNGTSPSPTITKSKTPIFRTDPGSAVTSGPPQKSLAAGYLRRSSSAMSQLRSRFQTYIENPTATGRDPASFAAQAAASSPRKKSTRSIDTAFLSAYALRKEVARGIDCGEGAG